MASPEPPAYNCIMRKSICQVTTEQLTTDN